jgi:hypothetical protein
LPYKKYRWFWRNWDKIISMSATDAENQW